MKNPYMSENYQTDEKEVVGILAIAWQRGYDGLEPIRAWYITSSRVMKVWREGRSERKKETSK